MKKSGNNIYFTHIPECFGATIVRGIDVNHDFRDHFHRSYNLGLITDGRIIFQLGNLVSDISQGTLYLLNPGMIHSLSGYQERGYSYLTLSIPKKQFYDIFHHSVLFSTHFLVEAEKSQAFQNCIIKILDSSFPFIEKQELLLDTLDQLNCIDLDSSPLASENLDAIYVYIREHYRKPIELTELASFCHLSPFHFLRIFKKSAGVSPFEYIIQLRIKEAQRLLGQGEKIAEVAFETGFYDQSHFTKYFKKYLGISPGDYCHNYSEILSLVDNPKPRQE